MFGPKSVISKSIYTSKHKAKSRLRLQASSTKCKYWSSPKDGRPLPPLTKAKNSKLLPVKSKKLLTTVVTVSTIKKGKATKGKGKEKNKTKQAVKRSKTKKNTKERRSPLMRRALKPLMLSSRQPAQESNSKARHKPLRKSQSPVMQAKSAKLVDVSVTKKHRGTQVLFLVKDGSRNQQYSDPIHRRKRTKKSELHSRSRARIQTDAQTDYDMFDRQLADNRYMKAIKSLSHSRRPAVGGVEFFYNLGRRVAPPEQRSRMHGQRLSGGGIGNDQLKDVEVPLTSRLPIIDFISTTEFQNMYAPQAKRAARRPLMS